MFLVEAKLRPTPSPPRKYRALPSDWQACYSIKTHVITCFNLTSGIIIVYISPNNRYTPPPDIYYLYALSFLKLFPHYNHCSVFLKNIQLICNCYMQWWLYVGFPLISGCCWAPVGLAGPAGFTLPLDFIASWQIGQHVFPAALWRCDGGFVDC